MSRLQYDQFIDDDEDESCPLCVEPLDLSDRSFKPCPCGYQICQFCYNNIKTTLNGLCPACRRPYAEESIEWKAISPEEMATYKAEIASKAKKQAAAKQKEAQKREADSLSRKHLAGLRVVQKNLVYVTGLSPRVQEEQLLETLRGDQYFGQYGRIIKIVVSKAKQSSVHPPQSVGVYVTFARKEDAATCIAAVDGSQNGERTLRAQYGTTKYCSAYLRGEDCSNRQCMFLHEPGEESESFTRHDLSSMNAIGAPQPIHARASNGAPRPPPPAPQQIAQPLSVTSQPMQREGSGDRVSSPANSADGPALPSSASWGSKVIQAQSSRRPSAATASSNASPMVSKPEPVAQLPREPTPEPSKSAVKSTIPESHVPEAPPPVPAKKAPVRPKQRTSKTLPFEALAKAINTSDFSYHFAAVGTLSEDDMAIVNNFPPLFDPMGGAKRRQIKEQESERRRAETEAQAVSITAPTAEVDDHPETLGGSLQLGGEPEERPDNGGQQQHSIQPPPQIHPSHLGLRGLPDDLSNMSIGRGITPMQQHQQQKQYLLQQFQSSNPQSAFQTGPASGHARNQSRFFFANDSSSASASVKPVANAKLMSQQSSMMPQQAGLFTALPHNQTSQFFPSGVQGPPPGLKSSGTPPMSGGAMFAQGHGFANSSLGYGANATGRQDAVLKEMMQGQRGNANQATEAQKREYLSSFLQHQNHPHQTLHNYPSTSTTPASAGPTPGHNLLGFSQYGGPEASSGVHYADSVGSSKKQKKKGKKHRHANTSSSGGGLVDVNADPSILQARLHQQHHQGGHAAGVHGLYGAGGAGGQGVGPGGLNSMYGGGYRSGW